MEQFLTKLRLFFGLSDDTTEAEVSQKLNEALKIKMAQGDGDAAGAKDTPEELSTKADGQEDTPPKAEEKSEEPSTEDKGKKDPVLAAIEKLAGQVSSMNDRITKMEESDAAPEAGGQREAAAAGDDAPAWSKNPINQRAAKLFPAEKK